MMLRRTLTLAALAVALCGCTIITNPVPRDYRGPLAVISDSGVKRGTKAFDFFFVREVNGNTIKNSLGETLRANEGMGFSLMPVFIDRSVPANTATFTIVGRTHYAAPILEMGNTVYQVIGKVTFTPVSHHSYRVKGSLQEDRSAIWVEDEATHQVMDRKIEIEGSAALDFFSK